MLLLRPGSGTGLSIGSQDRENQLQAKRIAVSIMAAIDTVDHVQVHVWPDSPIYTVTGGVIKVTVVSLGTEHYCEGDSIKNIVSKVRYLICDRYYTPKAPFGTSPISFSRSEVNRFLNVK